MYVRLDLTYHSSCIFNTYKCHNWSWYNYTDGSIHYLPLVKPDVFRSFFQLVNKIWSCVSYSDKYWNNPNGFAVLSSAVYWMYFTGNRCLFVNHISLGFDSSLCCMVQDEGINPLPSPSLVTMRVRLSDHDKPGWFPCHFDGHQFDLLKFPWLLGGQHGTQSDIFSVISSVWCSLSR